MRDVYYIDRKTNKKMREQIPADLPIQFLYGTSCLARWLRYIICRFPYFSKVYGHLQNMPSSRKKIRPFVEKYHIDTTEFLQPLESFATFNDFFIRTLKPSVRPMARGDATAILPADGRYAAFQHCVKEEGVIVKGQTFSLQALVGNEALAQKYDNGALLIGRLAPVDCHWFHFPCLCTPSQARLINGPLYSVSPLAVRHNIQILSENKRMVTHLQTRAFGMVLFIEVGATNVGTIYQTYEPEKSYAKGAAKGYFSFGGSCILLLFEPKRIQFDADLLANTQAGFETYACLGQSMGQALSSF